MSEMDPQSRRLDAYVRVSHVGKRGENLLSTKQQEDRIRAWATANGHEIVAVHEELNVSGGKMDRPKLNDVMRRIDDGETEGVVVFNLGRFGRTLVKSLELIEHIHKRGALFASVSDSFDITTPTGRLVLRMMLSLAEYELERIRENWLHYRNDKRAKGWHLGPTPFGYTRQVAWDPRVERDRPTGPLLVDPVEGPIVREVFERRAGGETWASIRDRLNASEIKTKDGATWTHSMLTRVVGRRTYLGFAGGGWDGAPAVADAHPALIDAETWHAAQRRRTARAAPDAPTVARGIVRCASCRYSLRPHKNNGAVMLSCSRRGEAGDCPDPVSIVAVPLNGHFALDDYVTEVMFKELHRIEFEGVGVGLADLQQAADDAEAALLAHAEDLEFERTMGRAAALRRGEALAADADAKREAFEEALGSSGILDMPVAQLERMWPELPLDIKQAHMARAIRYVFVRQRPNGSMPTKASGEASRRADLAARVRVVFTADDDVVVPRQGKRGYVIEPFVFPV